MRMSPVPPKAKGTAVKAQARRFGRLHDQQREGGGSAHETARAHAQEDPTRGQDPRAPKPQDPAGRGREED